MKLGNPAGIKDRVGSQAERGVHATQASSQFLNAACFPQFSPDDRFDAVVSARASRCGSAAGIPNGW